MTSNNDKKTTTTSEPTTIVSLDFTAYKEARELEPTHLSCDCETCRLEGKHTTDWTKTGPLPEAA